ncbi:MAG: DUF927 domain-containing protein [Magnetococcales bacterium]|nr:DUF927 domain-containing protein [Magnetococcales bacterium]
MTNLVETMQQMLANAPAANDVEPPEGAKVETFPGQEGRPCYRVYDDWGSDTGGHRRKPGVYSHGLKQTKEGFDLVDSFVCGPLHIDATLSDSSGGNFGRLLRFRDTRGRWKNWGMPCELLAGLGNELRGELLAQGLELDPHNRNHLAAYLQTANIHKHMENALTVGWHGGAFVLPGEVIGGNDSVHFQSQTASSREYARAGSLEGWRSEVSAYCVGNQLLAFALSVAFAGPLLAKVHRDGGGFNLFGDSSIGKSTALKLAASVWGGREYLRTWRATANGLEGAGTLFNDGLLCLDELGESDPREAGAVVYALANGQGKQRANRYGGAREVNRWRCILFSTGERTLAAHMAEGGREPKAGQSVRLLDLPCGRRFGLFDDLHGFRDGRALADHLLQSVGKHHGRAGRAFLERLVVDQTDLGATLATVANSERFKVEGGESQAGRAAKLFALVAVAGELATEYGVTGWPQGTALEAASMAFRLWRDHRGRGNTEQRQIIEKVSDFIDRHGDSRFSSIDGTDAVLIRDRAGWFRTHADGKLYLFTPGGLREALAGHDFKRSLDVLEQAGILDVSRANRADGRATVFTVKGTSRRLYVVNPGERHVLDYGNYGTNTAPVTENNEQKQVFYGDYGNYGGKNQCQSMIQEQPPPATDCQGVVRSWESTGVDHRAMF